MIYLVLYMSFGVMIGLLYAGVTLWYARDGVWSLAECWYIVLFCGVCATLWPLVIVASLCHGQQQKDRERHGRA